MNKRGHLKKHLKLVDKALRQLDAESLRFARQPSTGLEDSAEHFSRLLVCVHPVVESKKKLDRAAHRKQPPQAR